MSAIDMILIYRIVLLVFLELWLLLLVIWNYAVACKLFTHSVSFGLSNSPGTILADLNNTVVLMVSIHPPICHPASSLFKLLGTVQSVQATNCISVVPMQLSVFGFLARSKYLSFLFAFLDFHSVIQKDVKIRHKASSFFRGLSLLTRIKLSVFISKSQSILCISFIRTGSALCIPHLIVE